MRRSIPLFLIIAIFIFSVSAIVFPMLGREGMRLGLDLQGGIHIVYKADLSSVKPGEESGVMDGVIAVLNNRVNPLGVTEPIIQKQGDDRVVLELPGIDITDKQKERLSSVALLEFGEKAADNEEAKWEDELGRWKPATAVINGEKVALTSRYFKDNTYVNRDSLGRILLVFEWNEEGAKISKEVTTRLLNQQLGIFEGDNPLLGEDGRPIAPVVNDVIETSGVIEGLSFNEADTLSKQLNAGRLPVALEIIYDQTVSPILGANFVDMSVKAGIIGTILVILFMIGYYRLPGFIAGLALMFYAAAVLAIFKLVPVTLNLAGIGGFILSVGMAVDANVLIFERMKEEFRAGRTLGAAIEAGFNRAWLAIRDSNVTTFIVCLVLYWLGGSSIAESAPVMSFALTLFIGVAVSMFTAIFVTRVLLRLFVGTPIAQNTSLFKVYQGKNV